MILPTFSFIFYFSILNSKFKQELIECYFQGLLLIELVSALSSKRKHDYIALNTSKRQAAKNNFEKNQVTKQQMGLQLSSYSKFLNGSTST